MNEMVARAGGALAAVHTAVDRCDVVAAVGDVRSCLDLVRELEDLVLAAQLGQARVLNALEVRESAAFAAPWQVRPGLLAVDPAGPPGPDTVTPQEIAAHLETSVEAVRMRLTDAITLAGSLPRVCTAVEAGQLRWWQVRRTVQAVSGLVPEVVPLLDARLAELAAAGRTRSGFQGTLQRLILALDPERGERALDVAFADRMVSVRPDREVPGIGVLVATMPAEGAIALAACLDRLADTALSVPPAGLPAAERSADARRVDALTGLAGCVLDTFHTLDATADTSGVGAGEADLVAVVSAIVAAAIARSPESASATPPRSAGGSQRPRRRVRRRTGEVLVTMSVESLLGIREAPGELARWGPITATHARRLAQRAGTTWRRLLTDPFTGAVLDVGRTRHQPTAAITDHVLTRDGGRCNRPGCFHTARDLDHARAWDDGGGTSTGNLHAVCRSCHTAKHAGGWTVSVVRDGTTVWRTPHGHQTLSPPVDLRPEDRMPRPPQPVSRWAAEVRHDLHAALAVAYPPRPGAAGPPVSGTVPHRGLERPAGPGAGPDDPDPPPF